MSINNINQFVATVPSLCTVLTTPPDNVHIALSAGEIEQQSNVHPYQTMHEMATAFPTSHTHDSTVLHACRDMPEK